MSGRTTLPNKPTRSRKLVAFVAASSAFRTAATAFLAGPAGGAEISASADMASLATGPAAEVGPPSDAFDQTGVPKADQVELFGRALSSKDDDEVFVVVASPEGVSVVGARAAEDYSWRTVADLPLPQVETDLWLTNSCVTSSGDYMAIVYAPRALTNDEVGFRGGASAAVVDLRSGEVTELGNGYTLAYFNPGCGAGDSFAITRYESEESLTRIAVVDAASGDVVAKHELPGEALSATSQEDGTAYVVLQGDIVGIQPEGKPQVLYTPERRVYDLTADDRGRIAYVEIESDLESARAFVVDVARDSSPVQIARGEASTLGVQLTSEGTPLVVGASPSKTKQALSDVVVIEQGDPRSYVSSNQSLSIDSVLGEGIALEPTLEKSVESSSADTTAQSKVVLQGSTRDLPEGLEFRLESNLPFEDESGAINGEGVRGTSTPKAAYGGRGMSRSPLPANVLSTNGGDPNDPVEDERSCSIPRNDPDNQAYQPKPRQVEWAVNRAVKGELLELRPANWRNLGMPAHRAQQMYPPVALAGGGEIPSQIVLGVLMQESNMWQASRYTAPGNTGNPLIGDFYGYRAGENIWDIDYEHADCGYGVGQITDGMRLQGLGRTDPITGITQGSLPFNEQRAIALDYTVNIAKAVRMLGQKWNELAAAGMLINDGDANKIENWFFATWTYNSGFYPDQGNGMPWGVGWTNNPSSGLYPIGRSAFLLGGQQDSTHPQDWPYPEKVIGWAAMGTSLVETQTTDIESRTYVSHYISSFRTARWLTDVDRLDSKPPVDLFCDINVNNCDSTQAERCLLSDAPQPLEYRCWWNGPAQWKANCAQNCGTGFLRFTSSYATEASSMASTLPADTKRSSHLANCAAPPSGVVVVDNTKHANARNVGECGHRTTAGDFEFTFDEENADGNYTAKVDLHQQGGGYNGHFYFTHMRDAEESRATMSGKWSRGANLANQWVRVWVHMPDYAAWSQQAAYVIDLGDGTKKTRYAPQRRYKNEWVSLGVFEMAGEPTVTLGNTLTRELIGSSKLATFDDIAWDAVGFESLPGKPDDFVVALGDSYASGEGAGDYYAWSDNNGSTVRARNACHQSENAWIRKTALEAGAAPIGVRSDRGDEDLDFHMLACSGARTEHVLPFYSLDGTTAILNGFGKMGDEGQYGTVSQLDAGYLDENTTLVTLSIGGNDLGFGDLTKHCFLMQDLCLARRVGGGDGVPGTPVMPYTEGILQNEVRWSVTAAVGQVREKAPNARIALMGYPSIFGGLGCVISPLTNTWFGALTGRLNVMLEDVALANSGGGQQEVLFVDVAEEFVGHGACDVDPAIHQIVTSVTPGEKPSVVIFGEEFTASQQSMHPKPFGNDLYRDALQAALQAPA